LNKLHPILFIIFSLLSPDLIGQDFEEVSIQELIKGKPLIILDENLNINVYGKENLPFSFKVRRTVTYKVLEQRGIKLLNKIVLPGNLDPTYIPHGPAVKKLGVYFSGYDIEAFDVSIKRRGKVVKPRVKKKVITKESFNIDYLYEYDQHVFSIDGIEVGDEVKVDYNLDIPFRENYSRFASFRLFFHDSLPKIKYKLNISHHKSLDIQLYGYHGAENVSTVERDKILYYTWKYSNLSGCIKEEGSRPFRELPYITWIINHYRYFIHNSNQLQNVPHYAIIASLRSPNLFNILHALEIGSTNKNFAPFHKTYDKLTTGLSADFERVKYLHNYITENFKYQNDLEYYRRNDLRGDRLGEFFKNGILRDHNRYDLYYALLVKSNAQFYTSFLIDKRFGEISDEYFQPNFDSDFILASYFGEHEFDFIHPKSSSFGWFYNELPFYWQNCVTRLVHISDYASYKYPVKEIFRSVNTPKSNPEFNRRLVKSKVSVDLDLDSIYFETSIQLSGQFSTLCRPVYLNSRSDPTVDKRYRRPVWSVQGMKQHKFSSSAISKDAPFVSEFECRYVASVPFSYVNETYKLDIRSWFSHILPYTRSGNRYLNYYPDFMGKDEYYYDIQFARPVVLKNALVKNLTNNYARYYFEIKQISPNIIRVISSLDVMTEVVEASGFSLVKEISSAINSIPKVLFENP